MTSGRPRSLSGPPDVSGPPDAPFTRRDSSGPAEPDPSLFSDAAGAADGPALCEIHGHVLRVSATNARTLYREAGGVSLPVLDDGAFGFDVPQPTLGAEARTVTQSRTPRRARGTAAAAAERAQQLLSLIPGWSTPSAADADADGGGTAVPAAPPGARVSALAWQCEPALAPPLAPYMGMPTTTMGLGATSTGARRLCAAALADHSVVLYDLNLREWSPHKLSNTQQRDVHALAWQPLSATLLAVGCAKGVCLWRLSFSAASGGELSGGHMLRLLELPGSSVPATCLAFHPRGKWLAAGSAGHGQLMLWDCADASTATPLEMRGGGGVRLLRVSACGTLLLAAGAHGGVRVWETRGWSWESYARFGGAICEAAAWAGPPLLAPDAPRTLLVALRGEATLHALRFSHGAAQLGADYLGAFDLAPLAVGPVLSLAWEDGGQRLVVGSQPPGTAAAAAEPLAKRQRGNGAAAAPAAPAAPAAAAAAGGGTRLTVLSTRTTPSLQLHCIGQIAADTTLCDLCFPSSLPQGALLTAAWHDGRISLLPLHFL